MQDQGRRFKTHLDLNSWPEIDVRKYLENGSRVISIQAHNEGYEHFNCKVVFDINSIVSQGELTGP